MDLRVHNWISQPGYKLFYSRRELKQPLIKLLPLHIVREDIQYDRYKGADPIFKLSQWSYCVQIWHVQRKQSDLGSILMKVLLILNILASRRGWKKFWGYIFRGFELKVHNVGIVANACSELQISSKIQYFCGTISFFAIVINLEFTFSFITTFSVNKNDPKVIGFLRYHYNGYNKLSIINFCLPKVS